MSSRRFHCWSLEDNSSSLFYDSSRSLRDLTWSAEVKFRKNSGSFEADGCNSSLGVSLLLLLLLLHSLGKKLLVSSGIGRPSQWDTGWIADGMLRVFHTLLGNPFLNMSHHTEVAVCKVMSQLPPYHGHCKWQETSFAIHSSTQIWLTGHAVHEQSPALVLVAYFTTKV